jgi:hypothetical protein
MDEPRYAIYFVPPADSDVYRFGAGFLGYDCYTGADLGHPQDMGVEASTWAELTREPRKYGFHATLKAPFHLSPAFAESDIAAELRRLPPSRGRCRRSCPRSGRSTGSSPSCRPRRACRSIGWRRIA